VTRKLNRNIESVPITKATARAEKYCNVSSRRIQRMRNEDKCEEDGELSTPGKKRKRPKVRNSEVDRFYRRVIKDVIEDFFCDRRWFQSARSFSPC
jgi:hypothetical protein